MVALVAAFAALYTAGALVTYWYLTPPGASASFFPPAGLTLAIAADHAPADVAAVAGDVAVTEITIDLAPAQHACSWPSASPPPTWSSR